MATDNTVKTRFRFTDRTIEALPTPPQECASTDAEYSDLEVPGLKVFVGKGGRKAFHLRYRLLGRKRCIRIGPFPSVTVKDARLRAHEFKALVARDIDPLTERETKAAVPTFEEFATKHYLPFAKSRKRSWLDDSRMIKTAFVPAFGRRRITEITTRDVARLLETLKERRTASTSNRYFAVILRMFNLAVQWGYLERNPMTGLKKYPENNARERYLTADEIARLLKELEEWPSRAVSGLLRFLLFTGTRFGEGAHLTWDRVNLDNATVFLDKTKSGRTRTVLMNSLALGVLQEMQALRKNNHPFVFPGRFENDGIRAPRNAFKKLCRKLKLDNLKMHDLRHSFASLAVNAGASLYDVQKLLGHANSAMTQRYSHLSDHTLRAASETVAQSIAAATK
jgi:integrase